MCKQAFSESSLAVQMHTIMELFFPQKIAVKKGGGGGTGQYHVN